MQSMKNIGMLGAGSWGMALCWVLQKNGHKVTVWSALDAEIAMLKEKREQVDKLPGVILAEDTRFTTDIAEALKDKDMIVMAVPSTFVRSTAKQMAPYVKPGTMIVNVAKGIEEKTMMTLTDIIEEEALGVKACVLSGPSHAEEVGKGIPTTVVAGAKDIKDAEYIQSVFMNEFFRVYTSDDLIGIELGGALKNVIALAAGIADGLEYGDNTKAALMTRGIAEIRRLGVAMGGNSETFNGLTGIGDLIVTCGSMHSRNRRAGILLGKGYTMDEAVKEVKMVVEGIYSAKSAMELAEKYDVQLPIIEQVNKVLFENKNPREAVNELMCRDKKYEYAE